jgi:hypothetical protein
MALYINNSPISTPIINGVSCSAVVMNNVYVYPDKGNTAAGPGDSGPAQDGPIDTSGDNHFKLFRGICIWISPQDNPGITWLDGSNITQSNDGFISDNWNQDTNPRFLHITIRDLNAFKAWVGCPYTKTLRVTYIATNHNGILTTSHPVSSLVTNQNPNCLPDTSPYWKWAYTITGMQTFFGNLQFEFV